MVESHSISGFSFLGSSTAMLTVAAQGHIPSEVHESSRLPHWFLAWLRWNLSVVQIFISLNDSENEHIFMFISHFLFFKTVFLCIAL